MKNVINRMRTTTLVSIVADLMPPKEGEDIAKDIRNTVFERLSFRVGYNEALGLVDIEIDSILSEETPFESQSCPPGCECPSDKGCHL